MSHAAFRKMDGSNESEYSDPRHFYRYDWGDTLEITSPGHPSDDFVEGSTPVFSWTFSVQAAFRAVLERFVDAGDRGSRWEELEHDHEDWTVDATEGFELEPKVIRHVGGDRPFRITVYVRDDWGGGTCGATSRPTSSRRSWATGTRLAAVVREVARVE
jgi:hypothetical protein